MISMYCYSAETTYNQEVITNDSNNMYDVEYLNDWWEGEKYIRVTGIQGISDIKIKKL